jgi:hypothetical protein
MAENDNKTGLNPISQNEPSRFSFRDIIGIGMIVLSVGLLITISIIGFTTIGQFKDLNTEFTDIKELFGILLPLIGTWVGTVLAYYFSKDNFEAANKSVRDLVNQVTSTDEKLQELKVSDVMVKPEIFPYKTIDKLVAIEKCDFKIQELVKLMDDTNVERLPILEKDTLKFVFLFYRTTLERFQIGYLKKIIKLKDDNISILDENLTVQDMFDSTFKLIKDVWELTIKKKFLPVNAILQEARQMMLDNTICQDVFITKTGNRDEKVEGWITDTIIIEKTELFKKAGTRY